MIFIVSVFIYEMISEWGISCPVDRIASMFIKPQADRAHGLTYVRNMSPILFAQFAAHLIDYVFYRTIPFEIGHTQMTLSAPWTGGFAK